MIRVIIFLALVALLALGAAWLAERPGEIAIIWQGRIIETSLMVAMVALTIVVTLAVLLWSMVRTVLHAPDLIALFINRRRGVRGYFAISRGLIAVGAGDLRAARKFAAEAERLQPGEPLALLLSAQTAQLSDDRVAAESAFRAMAERDDTKLLGLRGLFVEARRREDMAAARNYAEEAAKTTPALAWAGQAALELRCASGDWAGALAALERNMKNRLIDKPAYKRQRAVLLTACALAAEETDRERARALALEAVKLAPSLVPAAELAGRLLAEANKLRKACRIIETAWQANPHPDLAETYAHLRFGDSARDRLARVQALAQKAPGDIESAIAVARAAIDAHEFAVARAALQPLLAEPTQRVAELMAELEHVESGDEGRSREWMARAVHAARDPAWTADGFVSDRWLPVSPVSGRLDSLQWQAPTAALGGEGAVIEGNDQPPPIDAPVPKAVPPTAASERVDRPQTRAAAAAKAMVRHSAPTPRVEAVIPLVHAPDDPGPEPSAEPEPAGPEPPADTWWRLRLFK
jgi:HemY protein